MIAMILLIYREPVGLFDTWTVGMVLLYVAVILTLWSMWAYLQSAWPSLGGTPAEREDSGVDKG
jgi:CDP-diacylglycerol--glycerol-3-phosphate 3-phosphatidyltransferase/cardiolipin synthase